MIPKWNLFPWVALRFVSLPHSLLSFSIFEKSAQMVHSVIKFSLTQLRRAFLTFPSHAIPHWIQQQQWGWKTKEEERIWSATNFWLMSLEETKISLLQSWELKPPNWIWYQRSLSVFNSQVGTRQTCPSSPSIFRSFSFPWSHCLSLEFVFDSLLEFTVWVRDRNTFFSVYFEATSLIVWG